MYRARLNSRPRVPLSTTGTVASPPSVYNALRLFIPEMSFFEYIASIKSRYLCYFRPLLFAESHAVARLHIRAVTCQ